MPAGLQESRGKPDVLEPEDRGCRSSSHEAGQEAFHGHVGWSRSRSSPGEQASREVKKKGGNGENRQREARWKGKQAKATGLSSRTFLERVLRPSRVAGICWWKPKEPLNVWDPPARRQKSGPEDAPGDGPLPSLVGTHLPAATRLSPAPSQGSWVPVPPSLTHHLAQVVGSFGMWESMAL